MSVDNRATAAHPAKVFALGGANGEGAEAVAHLAASDLVSEVVIADRDLAAAEAMAAELGGKASALQVDLMDGDALASQVSGYDIMVNSTGPEWKTVIRGLKVAIKAQVDYCDLCLHGPTTQEALALDGEAKGAGITAVVGSGFFGVTNLMMVHAARQLDDAEDLKSCLFMRVPLWEWFDPEETLAEWRGTGLVGTGWLSFMRLSSGKVRIYRDGAWTDVEPLENPARVGIPGACQVTAYPVAYPEAVTVPRSLSGVRSVASVIAMYPQELAEVYFELGRKIGNGDIDEAQAATEFFEYQVDQPKEAFALPEGYGSSQALWIEAVGTKLGRRVRYKCWSTGGWLSTPGPLAAGALTILRGDVTTHGVLSPDACFDPMRFFADVARLEGKELSEGELLGESIAYLE